MVKPTPPSRDALSEYAQRHAALADATRVLLLYLICDAEAHNDPATVTELARATGYSPSVVSRHVAQLARAGFVVAERHGQSVQFTTDLGICRELRGELDEIAHAPTFIPRRRAPSGGRAARPQNRPTRPTGDSQTSTP